MIQVNYMGNLGNNLFQYCIGRILAETLGYRLSAKPIPGFSATQEVIDGEDYSGSGEPIVLAGQKVDIPDLKKNRPKRRIVLQGYFQRYEYYKEKRDTIRSKWLKQDTTLNENIRATDLLVGIRRGRDYIPRFGIPHSYYEAAIAMCPHERLFICTNDPRDPFVRHYVRRYGGNVRPPGALDNLAFMSLFNQIVISNSSFLWWGAFLSDAKRIIYPIPKTGMWCDDDPISQDLDLKLSESRYTYIACNEAYRSQYCFEKLQNLYDDSRRSLRAIVPQPIWNVLRRAKSEVSRNCRRKH